MRMARLAVRVCRSFRFLRVVAVAMSVCLRMVMTVVEQPDAAI